MQTFVTCHQKIRENLQNMQYNLTNIALRWFPSSLHLYAIIDLGEHGSRTQVPYPKM